MSSGIPLIVRWLTKIGVIPKAAVTQLEGRVAPDAQSVLDAGRLAERTYALLDGLDDEVVLLARMGQNLGQFGLKYSHLGFAVRGLRRNEWGVVHLLNQEDGSRSSIYQEGLVNFYSDSPYRFEVLAVRLPADVQRLLKSRLLAVCKQLHCEHYSLTSYPWSLSTQNSNQWVLEVLAGTLSGCTSRQQAQEWLKAHHYEPSTLKIGLPTQWAGPLLRDSIRFTDQPLELRRQGLVQTVTVDSVVRFLTSPNGPFSSAVEDVRQIELTL